MCLLSSHHQSTAISSRKGKSTGSDVLLHLLELPFSANTLRVYFCQFDNYFFCCRLYRAYHKIYSSMHDKAVGPHKTQFRRDENYGKMFLFIRKIFKTF